MSTQTRPDEDYVLAAVHLENEVKAVVTDTVSKLPLTFKMIVAETQKDQVLQQVMQFLKEGWPVSSKKITDPAVRKFNSRRDGLQIANNCLMFGDRIVIPEKFRKQVLHQLHKGHPGMDRMKSLARSYIYWPNVDEDVKDFVRECRSCAQAAKAPTKTTLECWPVCTQPWQRVHIDYAGPIGGYYYLVIVDAYSKWPQIFRTLNITATATLDILRETFARYGNPETLVSDNGTQFTSEKFQQFVQENGINHMRTAPYHPQSNGQAERFVDSLKRGLKKLSEGESTPTLQHLQTFLFVYRNTPNKCSPQTKTPAELFLGRPARTTLDLLKKPVRTPTSSNDQQNLQFNRRHGAIKREFQPGDLVYAEYHSNNKKSWIPGRIVERKSSVNYNVFLHLGPREKLIRSHTNQLRERYEAKEPSVAQPVNLPWQILLQEHQDYTHIETDDLEEETFPPGPDVVPVPEVSATTPANDDRLRCNTPELVHPEAIAVTEPDEIQPDEATGQEPSVDTTTASLQEVASLVGPIRHILKGEM